MARPLNCGRNVSAVTDDMLVQIRALAGKLTTNEIAHRLGITVSTLENPANEYRISLRKRTVSAPAIEAQIKPLIGKIPARKIAQQVGLKYNSLLDWASRRGISLRANVPAANVVFTAPVVARIHELRGKMSARAIACELGLSCSSLKDWASGHGVSLRYRQRLTRHSAVYHRLAEMARLAGLRLSWRKNRVSILVSVAENLTPQEAEEFLRHSNGKARHDVAVVAYDKAVNGHQPRSLGAAAFPWDSYEQLRLGLAPKLNGAIMPPPMLSGCASL